jgi:hypothetical protein
MAVSNSVYVKDQESTDLKRDYFVDGVGSKRHFLTFNWDKVTPVHLVFMLFKFLDQMLDRPSLVLGVNNPLVQDTELGKLAFLVKYGLDGYDLRMPDSHIGCHAHLDSLHI